MTSTRKTTTQKTTLIRGGRVIDPANGIFDEKRTIYLRNGRIVSGLSEDVAGFVSSPSEGDAGFEAESGAENEVVEIFDACGAFVSPGFVDAHAHVLKHATQLGIDADEHCLENGEW